MALRRFAPAAPAPIWNLTTSVWQGMLPDGAVTDVSSFAAKTTGWHHQFLHFAFNSAEDFGTFEPRTRRHQSFYSRQVWRSNQHILANGRFWVCVYGLSRRTFALAFRPFTFHLSTFSPFAFTFHLPPFTFPFHLLPSTFRLPPSAFHLPPSRHRVQHFAAVRRACKYWGWFTQAAKNPALRYFSENSITTPQQLFFGSNTLLVTILLLARRIISCCRSLFQILFEWWSCPGHLPFRVNQLFIKF